MNKIYNPAVRDELLKTIEKLPMETILKIKTYVESILPFTTIITLDDIKARKNEILAIGRENGIFNISMFGSVTRGESQWGSDIDFLVDMEQGRSAFDLAGFVVDLEGIIGYRVDVALRNSLKPDIKEKILREAVPL